MNYTGKDGLKLLKYLDLKISERERKYFEEEWSRLNTPLDYSNKQRINGNLIDTIGYLYAIFLPAVSSLTNEKFCDLYRKRTEAYNQRIEKKGVEEKLKQGLPLDFIIYTKGN